MSLSEHSGTAGHSEKTGNMSCSKWELKQGAEPVYRPLQMLSVFSLSYGFHVCLCASHGSVVGRSDSFTVLSSSELQFGGGTPVVQDGVYALL